MSSLFHVVSGIIKIGFVLGCAGLLVHSTVRVGHLAFESSQTGLVSLKGLNNQLISGGRHLRPAVHGTQMDKGLPKDGIPRYRNERPWQ